MCPHYSIRTLIINVQTPLTASMKNNVYVCSKQCVHPPYTLHAVLSDVNHATSLALNNTQFVCLQRMVFKAKRIASVVEKSGEIMYLV